MRIDTDDLKVICGECLEPQTFTVREGLHGPEVTTGACGCKWTEAHQCGYEDGHADGHDEGFTDGRASKAREQKRTPVDLSAKPKEG